MYDQIRNKKGEKLYILTSVSTNNIIPLIVVDTWEKCLKKLGEATTEINTDSFFAQLIHKEINEENHKAKASLRCNRKGWGSDFFKNYTIEPIYTTN